MTTALRTLLVVAAVAALACSGDFAAPTSPGGSAGSSEVLLTGGGGGVSPLQHNGTTHVFAVPLSGAEEVPAVDTNARGLARFTPNADGTELNYELRVANIQDVTQAHIHLAPVDTNGSVVAFLFGFADPAVTVNGLLAKGTLTAADLVGPLSGEPLSALLAAMEDGGAYVNVHTVVVPSGEIRGQID